MDDVRKSVLIIIYILLALTKKLCAASPPRRFDIEQRAVYDLKANYILSRVGYVSVLTEVIPRSFTRVKVIKVLSFGRQKSHLGMWHIKRFVSPFGIIIRVQFWADIVHVDDSDEKVSRRGPIRSIC